MFSIRKTLLATSCALALAGPASATIVTEAFDGAWTNVAGDDNKGLLVDVLPDQKIFFGAFFTYANDGSQVWSIVSTQLVEGQNDYTNVPVLRYTGGRFSERGSPTPATLGTATLGFSCDGITMDITPAAGSNLTPANFVFEPSLGLKKLTSGQCNEPVASCPEGTTAVGNACQLPNEITGRLFLPAGKNYIVRGRVNVANGGDLVIAPGVTVIGSTDNSSPNFISVVNGGQIWAEGTKEQPITFTGPQEVPGSWAGIVIAGRSICNDGTAQQRCQFEAVPDIEYGNATPVLDDNSGALRYVRILWAGQQIAPDNELNALTLLGVGSGTVLENVQVDSGLDDGFEFFGGSVNGRYLVCSNMGDDCFDFDQGYNGKIQFALGFQGSNPDQNNDSNGIESDNDSSNNDKQPRTRPMVSNLTLIGNPEVSRDGARIRRGSGGNYANVLIQGYRESCLNLDDAGTFALGSASAQGEQLTFTHSHIGSCGSAQFGSSSSDPYSVATWFGTGAGNTATGDAAITGFLPAANSPLLGNGQALSDGFFRPANYRGAFAGPRDNWTAGWTVKIPR
ncbi:hypothetical protein [Aquimonas voraii]|uniref:MSHA biogenesis protein MshQ n=1 Tax=Aquimonas voraii TaxID=265719 RepID=A0A1G6X6G9_9GAMM|nr:hypothetical protein [Aquimonas voraii]SDD73712.1 hypothetical protein SAMN04488509_10662 [Aquimonas voraii]